MKAYLKWCKRWYINIFDICLLGNPQIPKTKKAKLKIEWYINFFDIRGLSVILIYLEACLITNTKCKGFYVSGDEGYHNLYKVCMLGVLG